MNCFYRILLSPSGFTNYGTQCMGNSNVIAVPKGQNVFSPDGSVFARSYCSNIPSTLYFEIYSFDRCAGSFINLSTFNSGVPSILTDGLAISPDSHYLYSSDQSSLRQFDLNAPNISSSQQLIAVNDSLGGFFQSQLAPDGRIYIVYASSTQLSVINQPDSAGVLCDFQAHSFTLPTINNLSMPNLPNFRLGKLVGSVCDTLIVSVTNQQYRNNSIKAYPNPASDFVSFSLDIVSNNAPMKLEIFNSLSQKVKEMNLSPYQGIVRLDVRNFAPGIYFAVFKNGEEVLAQCKFSTCK